VSDYSDDGPARRSSGTDSDFHRIVSHSKSEEELRIVGLVIGGLIDDFKILD